MPNPLHILERLLRVLARPVQARSGLTIQPYRGYGTAREIHLMGRVFRQPALGFMGAPGTPLRLLANLLRRLLRWGVGGARLVARVGETEHTVTADDEGYFRLTAALPEPLPSDRHWHAVDLRLVAPTETDRPAATATGQVFVPPPSATRVVISDIDDTVMHTGVANVFGMIWRLFAQDAESRVAFPGVAAFYRALHAGPPGDQHNPMLYVSRGPWSIYPVLDAFFNRHGIPVGPVLFLRDWGLTLQHPLPRRSEGHKRRLLDDMLARYPDLPFVLIGDSGQHDPETYAQVIRDYPGRVEAAYIRDLGASETRAAAIAELAHELEAAGSPLVLAADSTAMARHAAGLGLVDASAAEQVARDAASA